MNNPNPKMGRLNIDNEKGLYLAKKLGTAIKECDIKNGDTFSVAIFKPKVELSILSTYVENKYGDIIGENKEKADLINNFVKTYLIKSENGNNSNIYRVTNIIAKIFYKLFNSDGLLYFSSKDDKNFNLFINEKSIQKLEMKYVFNCKKDKKIIFDQFVEIEDNKIVPKEISDNEKNEILRKVGCSISKINE
jgi:murein L,D-transpeptidase YafK